MAIPRPTPQPANADGAESPIQRPTPAAAARRAPSSGPLKSTFAPASVNASQRMVISLSGEEKSGKDHTALTFPEPIYIHSFDIGLEGVVDKFINGTFGRKKIYLAEYELEVQPGEASAQVVADSADRVWEQFVTNYKDGLASCGQGTTICDTISEAWELIRLARFGKLTQIMPHMYGPVNAEFRDILRESYNHAGNTVYLSKLVDEWENYTGNDGKEKGRKTGNKTRKGFADLPFQVQINALCNREDRAGGGSDFTVTIEDCRFNPDANGITIPNDYDMIRMVVFGE